MKLNLFNYLFYAIPKHIEDTRAKRFFDLHSNYLALFQETHNYQEARTNFEVIQANIIIKGLMNKKFLENKASLAKKTGLTTLPSYLKHLTYMKDGDDNIALPFFSKTINKHYVIDTKSLADLPYRALRTQKTFSSFYENPFEKYGYRLFDSMFTNWIPVMKSPMGDSMAFVDLEVDTIYIVTDQGTLERAIPYFDQFLEIQNRKHLLDKIKQLVETYYSFDKIKFIDSLFSLGFISFKLYNYLKQEEIKAQRKENKALEKAEKEIK